MAIGRTQRSAVVITGSQEARPRATRLFFETEDQVAATVVVDECGRAVTLRRHQLMQQGGRSRPAADALTTGY